ncbi:solute:sodium symporter family transporter [Tenuifilaceae bacterium CYCD]|nr:solute:sodium symporter family transporter [Tenuifilaceae bacterium CYCD]
MSPTLIAIIVVAYFCLLLLITYLTSRNATSQTFYLGNKRSPWYVVAFGMIGASLSGVTFMSVPGDVMNKQFTYMMMVFGFLAGYAVIATVLMPLYYRLNLTSIYSYLEERFGNSTYKTGASFFLLSRVIGASLRMFIVVNVLQIFVFDAWNIPFFVTIIIFIVSILIYTFKGGIRTIIWTDTLQTTFMLLAVVLSIVFISKELQLSFGGLITKVFQSEYSKMLVADWSSKQFFLKQFFSGMFIAITMTGLDQEMMQKNLSCRSLRDAQKNMFSFSFVLVFVNMMFLVLGAILIFYANSRGITVANTDDLFPTIAIHHMAPIAGIIFIVGLISAAYPSADGALTSLTTSFCIDILGLNKFSFSEDRKIKIRYVVHLSFALILMLSIFVIRSINDEAIIQTLYKIAGYTYGPLLGLYSFGMFTKWQVKDRWIPLVAIVSPIICYFLSKYSIQLFGGYQIGFELIILNGTLTFLGLMLFRVKNR